MAIRVVVAGDPVIVRQGLVSLLEHEADIEVVGQADDGLELVNLVRRLQPDVAVTDITLPGLNWLEAISRILAQEYKPKVVCLSVHGDPRLVCALLGMGVMACLVKGCAFHELILAVRSAKSHQTYLSKDLAKAIIPNHPPHGTTAALAAQVNLTSREREIVRLFAEGQNTHQIALRLHISEKTVASHREHFMEKLGITGIAELTRYAIRVGLSPCPVITFVCENALSPCSGVGGIKGNLNLPIAP